MASDARTFDRSDQGAAPGESNEKKKQAALQAWRRTNLLVGLVVFSLVAISLLIGMRGQRLDPYANRRPSLTASFDQLRSSAEELVASEQQAAARQRTRVAEAERELLRLEALALLQQTEHLGDDYDAARQQWLSQLESAANSTAGKRLLADEAAWQELLAMKRLTDARPPIRWRQQTERLIREAADTPSESLLASHQQATNQLHERLRSEAANLRDYQQRLEELIEATASRQPVAGVSGDLFAWHAERVATEQRERAAQAARDEEERIAAELEELGEQRRVLLVTADRLTRDLEAAKRGEAPTSAARMQTDTAAYRSRLPEMRRLLRPFITPGYAQPSGRDGLAIKTTKQPMSYSGIRAAGALEESEAGLQALFRLGGWKAGAQKNDRPLGDFPRMNSEAELAKPAVRTPVRRAQQLLRDYGPQLVRDRLLIE